MAATARHADYFWPALWGAVAAAFAAVLALEIAFGDVTAGEGPRPPARVAEAKLLPPFALPPEAQAGTETVSRPLFMPLRRPAPPATAADATVMKKGQFVLQGTTVIGDLSFAMLKEVSSNRVHRVAKGGKVLDMTLSEVGPGHAVLSLGGDSESIPLLVAKSSGQPAAATANAAMPAGPFGGPPTPPGAGGPPNAAAIAAAQATAQAARAAQAAQAAATGSRPGVVYGPINFQPSTAPQPAVVPQPIPRLTPNEDVSNLTPEEILARRRAARRSAATN